MEVSKSLRVITGYNGHPQLYITKELKKLKWKPGDYVIVLAKDNKIIIQKAEIKVET